MIKNILIVLNVVMLLFSILFLLLGGVFSCNTSYVGQFYGNLATAASIFLSLCIYIIDIPSKNNGKFPITSLLFCLPFLLILGSILVMTQNIKKFRVDILKRKANVNYYIYSGIYVMTVAVIVLLQIFRILLNSLFRIDNAKISRILNYALLVFILINCFMCFKSNFYLKI